MQLVIACTILSLAVGSFAGPGFRRSLRHSRGDCSQPIKRENSTNTFTFDHRYQGEDFLDKWDFFSGADPTHGLVDYQSKEDAINKGLAYIQDDGTTVLAVDNATSLKTSANRDSIRIQSQRTYDHGLFIADFEAMPHGCSVWPAYWSVGPGWPNGGEIDILEGVHDQPTNQYTLHTSEGCTLSTGGSKVSAKQMNPQCGTINGDNTGCSFADTDTRSYGKPFNDIGGGVFAHQWDSTGIRVWHFARDELPADIAGKEREMDTSTWGPPAAFWDSKTCHMENHFYQHKLVLDITLCGDWAGPTYGGAGCPGTCTERVADPSNFDTARWKLNYISVYQSA
ncbi:glycoside hydrolase family 16 protein [Crucibulum laeve]|uniref:Glycoside hydrolase family 16 protein n=1 Tax=Crucibulum laeve TaxID=68775 RepID=A0A5C3M536_9AGAR|nr:glycoside hydrolase family 16 protein [Crucibulum laeve]